MENQLACISLTLGCPSQETHKLIHKHPNYILHIQLVPGEITNPAITRTLSCPASATFASLHRAIQIAFGWATTHTYDFVVKDPTYVAPQETIEEYIQRQMARDNAHITGRPVPDPGPRQFLLRVAERPEGDGAFGAIDRMHERDRQHPRTPECMSHMIKLHTVFDDEKYKNHELEYMYDFGDHWAHVIQVVGRADTTSKFVCTDGEGHGCAEDAGGTTGWEELKSAYTAGHPNKEQREKMKWFETSASNRDTAGLKGPKVRSWPKTKVNSLLADLGI
jgi:hypothetical protein